MNRFRLLTGALALFCISGGAGAETQLERDKRRASYIAGFECWIRISGGQQARIRYEEGGAGEIAGAGGSLPMQWSVREDRLCVQFLGARESCADLPPLDTGGEKEKILKMLRNGCLF